MDTNEHARRPGAQLTTEEREAIEYLSSVGAHWIKCKMKHPLDRKRADKASIGAWNKPATGIADFVDCDPSNNVPGVVPSSIGLSVIDCDTKLGKDDILSSSQLAEAGAVISRDRFGPEIGRVKSASGGIHMFYSAPFSAKSDVDRSEAWLLGDTRGSNGYIIAYDLVYLANVVRNKRTDVDTRIDLSLLPRGWWGPDKNPTKGPLEVARLAEGQGRNTAFVNCLYVDYNEGRLDNKADENAVRTVWHLALDKCGWLADRGESSFTDNFSRIKTKPRKQGFIPSGGGPAPPPLDEHEPEPEPTKEEKNTKSPEEMADEFMSGFQDVSDFTKPPEVRCFANGLAYEGKLTLLNSPPKLGKTTLLSAMFAEVSKGGDFLGRKTEADNPVLLWIGEDTDTLQHLFREHGGSKNGCAQFRSDVTGLPSKTYKGLATVMAIVKRTQLKDCDVILVIDTFSHFAHQLDGVNSDSTHTAEQMMQPLKWLAGETGMSVIVNHHVGRDKDSNTGYGTAGKGNTALEGAVDMVALLGRDWKDAKARRFSLTNMGARRGITIKRHNDVVGSNEALSFTYELPDASAGRDYPEYVVEDKLDGGSVLNRNKKANDKDEPTTDDVIDVLEAATKPLTFRSIRVKMQDTGRFKMSHAGTSCSKVALAILEELVEDGEVTEKTTKIRNVDTKIYMMSNREAEFAQAIFDGMGG